MKEYLLKGLDLSGIGLHVMVRYSDATFIAFSRENYGHIQVGVNLDREYNQYKIAMWDNEGNDYLTVIPDDTDITPITIIEQLAILKYPMAIQYMRTHKIQNLLV